MGAWCVTSGVSFMQNVNDRLHFTGNLPHFYYRIARTTDPVSENRPKKLVKRQEWGAKKNEPAPAHRFVCRQSTVTPAILQNTVSERMRIP